jgi:hypothetical protein
MGMVASAGDVDGDGNPDMLITDPGYASGPDWGGQGITYVFDGEEVVVAVTLGR